MSVQSIRYKCRHYRHTYIMRLFHTTDTTSMSMSLLCLLFGNCRPPDQADLGHRSPPDVAGWRHLGSALDSRPEFGQPGEYREALCEHQPLLRMVSTSTVDRLSGQQQQRIGQSQIPITAASSEYVHITTYSGTAAVLRNGQRYRNGTAMSSV